MGTPAAPLQSAFVSGVDGALYIDGVQCPHQKWSGTDSCPMSDRTNGLSGGYQTGTRTVKSFNGTGSCVVPAGVGGDPIMVPGATYPGIFITHDARGYSGNFYVENVKPTTEVTGDLGYDFDFKSVGPYTAWTNADLPAAVLASVTPPIVSQGANPATV